MAAVKVDELGSLLGESARQPAAGSFEERRRRLGRGAHRCQPRHGCRYRSCSARHGRLFGVSFGFMLPVSTPPNAIVYGSGMVPITRMIRSGFVFDLIGALVIATGVTLWAGVVGFR